MDWRHREVGTLYLPDLDCFKPVVGLEAGVEPVVGLGTLKAVLLKEFRVFLQVFLLEPGTNLEKKNKVQKDMPPILHATDPQQIGVFTHFAHKVMLGSIYIKEIKEKNLVFFSSMQFYSCALTNWRKNLPFSKIL